MFISAMVGAASAVQPGPRARPVVWAGSPLAPVAQVVAAPVVVAAAA